MSYYPRGRGGDDDVDDFDEYDPTPYGGGYDQSLTYGRALSPSDDICYPSASSSGGHNDFDYDRPSYTSSAQPSAYADDALDNEYKSYSRPGRPSPAYSGFQPHLPTPPGGDHYEDAPAVEYGGRPTVYGGSGNQYGSGGYGGGRKNEYDTPPAQGYGSGGYGGRRNDSEYDAPPAQGYGGSEGYEYDAPPAQGYGGSGGYGRTPPQGYGRKSEYDEPSSEYGRKTGYGGGSRKSDDDDDDKPRYAQEEGYGRNKYGDNDSDDDDEKKKHHKHHNRRHYDD